ncbi:MAG: ABC transporter permease subunit [Streptosporangiales bacterium]|nr:ABC transporter permease subunit [Streptosporangiales bacterium]
MTTQLSVPDTQLTEPDEPAAARVTWTAFRRNPLGMAAIGVMALFAVVAVAAPLIADYPSGHGPRVLVGPSSTYWFGTDGLGRDIFSEVVWGTRSSLLTAVAATILAVALGLVLAVTSVYFKWLDGAVGVVVDLVLSLPVLPLMLLVAALVGPSQVTVVLVIAFFSWPEVARIVRSQGLTVVRLPYVDAARVVGGSSFWIIRRHIVPAVAPVVVVALVLTVSRAVLVAAGLSFLGVGDPNAWSWGRILFEAQQSGAMQSAWWTALFPSLAIFLLVLSAILVSIAYDDARHARIWER